MGLFCMGSAKEEPKTLTKTQIMQGRKAQKAATRSLTRSFTTGLMPLSLSARSSDPDVPVESPRFVASARSAKDEDEGEGLSILVNSGMLLVVFQIPSASMKYWNYLRKCSWQTSYIRTFVHQKIKWLRVR